MTKGNDLIGRRAVQYPEALFEGICRDMPSDLFYGESKLSEEAAKSICRTCPVIEPCREWGIVREVFGVWGGLTPRERQRERSRRRITVTSQHIVR